MNAACLTCDDEVVAVQVVVTADVERKKSNPPVPADDVVKMRRRRNGRAVAGVAGGIADHLDIRVLWVRLAFAVLAALGGAGVLAYGLLWVFVPQQTREEAQQEVSRKERQQARGLLALGIGLAIGAGTLSGSLNGWVAGGIGVTLVGVALVWREAADSAPPPPRRGGVGAGLRGGGRRAPVPRPCRGAPGGGPGRRVPFPPGRPRPMQL